MTLRYIVILLVLLIMVSCKETKENNIKIKTASNYKTTGSIERLHPGINGLLSENAKIEILAEGFTWTEGPLWVESGNYLLFSDIPPNMVNKWSEKDGLSEYLKPSGYTGKKERSGEPGSNGLILDRQGNLVLSQHGDRRMARMMTSLSYPKPEFETIVDNYQDKRLNSPNDAVYDNKGNLYFTDPPYGLEDGMDDWAKELDFQGVYRYSVGGTLSLISDQLSRPNGIGLSPDEKTLYVANSDPKQPIWTAFDLSENGEVLGQRLFYDATGAKGKGLPDGLKVDKSGNIWASGPGGIWIFNPSGKVLGKILTGEATSNCAFDTLEKVLYMTCDDYLMRIRL